MDSPLAPALSPLAAAEPALTLPAAELPPVMPALAELPMVEYAVNQRHADAARVYIMGTSS
jgi:hypothetical protein